MVTSNEKLMAKAVIHSGSYGHFHTVSGAESVQRKMLSLPQHIACPKDEELMLEAHARVPNFSLRMTPLAALLILDQLPKVEAKIEALNRHYAILEAKLGGFLQGSNYQNEQVSFPVFDSHNASLKNAMLDPVSNSNFLGSTTQVWSRLNGITEI